MRILISSILITLCFNAHAQFIDFSKTVTQHSGADRKGQQPSFVFRGKSNDVYFFEHFYSVVFRKSSHDTVYSVRYDVLLDSSWFLVKGSGSVVNKIEYRKGNSSAAMLFVQDGAYLKATCNENDFPFQIKGGMVWMKEGHDGQNTLQVRSASFGDAALIEFPATWSIQRSMFSLTRTSSFRFAPADVTNAAPLYWLTYTGGSDADEYFCIAKCPDESVIIGGRTASPDFPVSPGAVQTTYGTNYDAMIARVSPTGQRIWATFYGGAGYDVVNAVSVKDTLIAIIGSTNASDLFMVNPAQPANAGSYDAFVLLMDTAGNLIRSTYFGSTGGEQGIAIAIHNKDSIYIGGSASSPTLPMSANGFQQSNNGALDAFITLMNAQLNPVWTSFYGGSGAEDIHVMSIDSSGNPVFCGGSYSNNFPVTPNAWQSSTTGTPDVYYVKFSPAGNRIYATLIGGFNSEDAYGIACAADGSVYISGFTFSIDFPTAGQAYQTLPGGQSDAFLLKLDANGQLVWSTFFGGNSYDYANSMYMQGKNLYVAGSTESPNLHVSVNAYQDSLSAFSDGFIVKFDTTGDYIYSTFLGGSSTDQLTGIVVLQDTSAIVVGNTFSNDLPSTPGTWQQVISTLGDGFLARTDVSEEPFTTFASGLTEDSGILLFPNPAIDAAQINAAKNIERITIRSIDGKVMLDQSAIEQTNYQVNTAQYPSGTYIVSVVTEDGTVSHLKMIRK
ncbi:MAG: hypothetical protein Fur0041_04930 [Bacteroidia bacterium]